MAGENVLIGNVTLGNFLVFIFIFIVTIFFGNLAYALVRRFLDNRISTRNSKTIARVTEYGVLILGLFYGIYHVLGLDFTALIASLGILTIAVAFSSQQIIQNFIAGILVSVDRPIQIGEWVEVGGLPNTDISRVVDITLMKTILKDMNGRVVIIPNSLLLSSKVINYTRGGFIEIPVQLIISQDSDHEKIKRVIQEVANESPRILPNVHVDEKPLVSKILKLHTIQWLFEKKRDMSIFEPKVLTSEISNSEVTLSIRFWIREINKRDEVVSEFLNSLLKRFAEERIKLTG